MYDEDLDSEKENESYFPLRKASLKSKSTNNISYNIVTTESDECTKKMEKRRNSNKSKSKSRSRSKS